MKIVGVEFSSFDGEVESRTVREDGSKGPWRRLGGITTASPSAGVRMHELRKELVGKEE